MAPGALGAPLLGARRLFVHVASYGGAAATGMLVNWQITAASTSPTPSATPAPSVVWTCYNSATGSGLSGTTAAFSNAGSYWSYGSSGQPTCAGSMFAPTGNMGLVVIDLGTPIAAGARIVVSTCASTGNYAASPLVTYVGAKCPSGGFLNFNCERASDGTSGTCADDAAASAAGLSGVVLDAAGGLTGKTILYVAVTTVGGADVSGLRVSWSVDNAPSPSASSGATPTPTSTPVTPSPTRSPVTPSPTATPTTTPLPLACPAPLSATWGVGENGTLATVPMANALFSLACGGSLMSTSGGNLKGVVRIDLGASTPLNGVLTVTTCGLSSADTVLWVGTGCPTDATAFGCVGANDDASGGTCGARSSYVVPAATQRYYTVVVGGYSGVSPATVASGLSWSYVRLPDGASMTPTVTPSRTPSGSLPPSGTAPPTSSPVSRTATPSRSIPPSATGTGTVAPAAGSLEARLLAAFVSGNGSALTGAELRAAIAAENTRASTAAADLRTAVFAGASVSYNPYATGYESVSLFVEDTSNTHPLLLANWKYTSTGAGAATPSPAPLLAVGGYPLGGLSNGARFVAFGNHPLRTDQGDAAFQAWVKRAVTWALSGTAGGASRAAAGNPRVTVAHLPNAAPFYAHETAAIAWVRGAYASTTVNAANACDNDALAGCLAASDLLVIGNAMGTVDDAGANAATTVPQYVADAVASFMRAGGAVVYVHYKVDCNGLCGALFPLIGLSPSVVNNVFNRYGVSAADGATGSDRDMYVLQARALDAIAPGGGPSPLVTADFGTCSASDWPSCTAPAFRAKIGSFLFQLRGALQLIDTSSGGPELFALPGRRLLKLNVLLGDALRAPRSPAEAALVPVAYPPPLNDWAAMASFMFADATVAYRRSSSPGQADLGTLLCPRGVLQAGGCMAQGYDIRSYRDQVTVYPAVTLTEREWARHGGGVTGVPSSEWCGATSLFFLAHP
jgi:hypothetical protein